jgi:hypothetical protein
MKNCNENNQSKEVQYQNYVCCNKVFFIIFTINQILKIMRRKIHLSLLSLLFISLTSLAQAPERIHYQAVARDNGGAIIANQSVNFRLSIRDLSPAGAILYSETHLTSTNAFGLVNLEIGGGVLWSGSFAAIDWGNGSKYLQVELDPAGGTAFAQVGTSQLLSVPYALYSGYAAAGLTGPTGPTGPVGVSMSCGTTYNADYTVRGNGSSTWECTDALQISSTGYVSVNTSPSSSYRFRVYGNSGFGTSPSSSYDFSVDGSAHFADYLSIGTTPSSSYTLRVYGNTAIGTSVSSSYTLDVDGDTRLQDGLGVGTAPPTSGVYVGSSSNFYIPTSVGTSSGTTLVISSGRVYKLSSSSRYKESIADLSFDKEKFLTLRPVNFRYKISSGGNGEMEAGFIAEEVEKAMPELVIWEYQNKLDDQGKPIINEFGYEERVKTGRTEGVKYDQLCVYLYQLVADQEQRITELERSLEEMRNITKKRK